LLSFDKKAVRLNTSDINGLLTSSSFSDFKGNPIQFLKYKKAMVFDPGTVNENVVFSVRFYETVAFLFAVPFDSTFSHWYNSSFTLFNGTVNRDVASEKG
jgi:hypothetical protein